MSNDIAIKVKNLTKTYKLYNKPIDRLKEALSPIRRKYHHDFHALHDVSFDVMKGETVGIIGKNGSGKSTLLKILTGVLTPTGGSVIVNGRISALLELGTGFNPELTGLENVYFNGTLMGYSKEDMDSRLDEILSFADIGEFVCQPVKTYSSGMFVRLAFAVAVNIEPDILVIDEAMAVGDLRFQKKCKEKIEDKKTAGVTIILVSHSMADIRSTCDSVVYLEHGQPKYIGEASEGISLYYYDNNISQVKHNDVSNLPSNHVGDVGGTGDIIINNVKCYQKDKCNEYTEIEYGKNIIIEIKYNAVNKIENPIFRVNFSVAGYKYFANIDSTESTTIDYIQGEGTVLLEICKPNLYPQAYSVNIGVIGSNTNIKYFYWTDAAKFIIVAPPNEYLVHPTSIIKLDGLMQLLRGTGIE